jgi:hypothetical protein
MPNADREPRAAAASRRGPSRPPWSTVCVSMTDLEGRLESLTGELGKLGSPINRYLRPGRPEADVRAALEALGLTPPAELVQWYGWHDGIDYATAAKVEGEGSSIEVFFSLTPLSLDEAVGLCRERRTGIRELFGVDPPGPEADPYWRDPWFPILEGGDSLFAVDCTGDAPRETAPIWRVFSHPGPFETGIVADSLSALVERMATEVRAGSLWWDEDSRSLQPREADEWRLAELGLY